MRYETDSWAIELAMGWHVKMQVGWATVDWFCDPQGTGALRVVDFKSYKLPPGNLGDGTGGVLQKQTGERVRRFAEDGPRAYTGRTDLPVFPTVIGEFAGYTAQFVEGDEFNRMWWLKGKFLLFEVRYLCCLDGKGRDDEVVNAMLGSLVEKHDWREI